MASRETARDTGFVEITPEVLLKAYACGIFPMAEPGGAQPRSAQGLVSIFVRHRNAANLLMAGLLIAGVLVPMWGLGLCGLWAARVRAAGRKSGRSRGWSGGSTEPARGRALPAQAAGAGEKGLLDARVL